MDLDADATNVEQLPVEPPVIPPRRKIKTTTLRDLEQSDRHFWKDSLAEQLAQSVKDKSTDGNLRKLPGNETTVMALNEIAVQRGRGFFYHFRETHGGWKSHSNEDLWPGSRDHRPGTNFPSIAYMNFVWTSKSTSNFLRASHRSRYLTCDGLTTPPVDNAPLYAMQYIEHSRYPVFATPRDTHIVFATSSTLHLVRTSQWKDVVGLQSAANGKFNTVPFLWINLAAGSSKKAYEAEIRSKMIQFESQSVEALYDEIVARCRFGVMPSAFTAYGLRQTLIGPSSPATGIALGTPLEFDRENYLAIVDSSNPPCRRRNYLRRGRAGRELESDRRAERFSEETKQDEAEVT